MTGNCPVTLDELKDHLHILSEDFDKSLSLNLRAATQAAQSYLGRDIIRTVTVVSMPFSKTFNIADFSAIEDVQVDRKEVEYTQVNNTITLAVNSGELVEYKLVSGYTQEDCPEDIKMAILLIASKYFNNPVDSVEQLPKASTNLLKPYKNYMI